MLKAKGLGKLFGDRWALRELDLEIQPGRIQCLLGANGAGKTTTINLFLGFLEPTTGAAYVNGSNVQTDAPRARADLAYVPEQVSLYPTLTGLENLVYFTRLSGRGLPHAEGLRRVLRQAGLEDRAADTRVERYSKGMRQKVGLAIAMAKGARALLLDEPLSGLDPQAANEFCGLLQQMTRAGTTVLLVTHDLFRAKELGGRIGIMRDGCLVEDVAATDLSHGELERVYLSHMRAAGRGNGE